MSRYLDKLFFSEVKYILMDYKAVLENTPQNINIYNSLLKARAILEVHRRIAVSVSGGSDSDNAMDLL